MRRLFAVFILLAFSGILFSGSAASAEEKRVAVNPPNEGGKLRDWKVMIVQYAVNAKGQKKQIRWAVRSPDEVFEKNDPYYDRYITFVKEGRLALLEDRYDMHEVMKSTEKPVKPGTVVYYMPEPKPDWSKEDVVREVYDQVEIRNKESGQFILVEKPRALKETYLDAYHKKIEEVRFVPQAGDVLIYGER